MRKLLIMMVALFILLGFSTSQAKATLPVNYADTLTVNIFHNSTGSESWRGDWVSFEGDRELNPTNTGPARIVTGLGLAMGYYYPAPAPIPWESSKPVVQVHRFANLSSFSTADLSIEVSQLSGNTEPYDAGDKAVIQVTGDNGDTWTTIRLYADEPSWPISETLTIPTRFLTSDFGVRFRLIQGYGATEHKKAIIFKNLDIEKTS